MADRHHPPPTRLLRHAPLATLLSAALAASALAEAPSSSADMATLVDPVTKALRGDAGPLQIHVTRAELLTAAAGMALNEEDFSGSLQTSFSVGSCFQAVSSMSNDPCYLPGVLQAGINIRSGGANIFSQYVAILGEAILGTPTKLIGADAFASLQHQTRIDFDPYPTVVGMDVYDGMQGELVQVWAFDADEALIGTFTVAPAASNVPAFAGFISPVPVRRVELDALAEGGAELFANLVWGGGAGRLEANESTVDFGVIATGSHGEAQVTLVNAGHLDLLVSPLPSLASPFHVLADDCSGSSLAMAQSCTLTIGFAPEHKGEFQRRLALGGDESLKLQAQARDPRLITMPGHLDFGSVAAGTISAPQAVTIVNLTGAEVSSSAMASVAPPFMRTGGDCASATLVLAPGESCTVQVSFAPQTAGDFDAEMILPGNASRLGTATLFGHASATRGGGQ